MAIERLSTRSRRALYVAAALVLGMLAIGPRYHVARAVVLVGAGAPATGQFGALGANFGPRGDAGDQGRVAFAVARSVIREPVDMHQLAGGMIEITFTDRMPARALATVRAVTAEMTGRLRASGIAARSIDLPHLDPERRLNAWAVALLGLLALLAFFTEAYRPSTAPDAWARPYA